MISLAANLYREVGREFFRLLAGESACFYLDALDAFERAGQSSGSFSRVDALEIVEKVLHGHPEFIAREEFPDAKVEAATLQGQAGLILRRLVETGWLHEPPRPDWQRIYHLSANGEILLAALRQIAHGETAQFTDKLQLACAQLLNPDAFTDSPLGDLEGCLANVRQGLRELRQMENGIVRHTRNLLAATTLKDNLTVLYDEFSETIGHACYRELVRAQLPTRIIKASRRLDELSGLERILDLMQRERLRRSPQCDAATAAIEIRLKLDELAHLLESMGPQADELDRRAADFARRAFARVRYLQEVSGGQREKVQMLFGWIDEHYTGLRFSELPESLEFPSLLIAEAGVLSADSLRKPSLRREAGEIEPLGDDLTDEERDAAVREVEAILRDSMNVMRANRFVAQLNGSVGTRFSMNWRSFGAANFSCKPVTLVPARSHYCVACLLP